MRHLLLALSFAALAALPVAQTADAASKRQATDYVCHWSHGKHAYILLHVADPSLKQGHDGHPDFLASADTDCNAV